VIVTGSAPPGIAGEYDQRREPVVTVQTTALLLAESECTTSRSRALLSDKAVLQEWRESVLFSIWTKPKRVVRSCVAPAILYQNQTSSAIRLKTLCKAKI
jgi:hypothetical protein